MSKSTVQPITHPVTMNYEADLCGNIEQALKGLQGYGIMALELVQNADDARASVLTFDACANALFVRNDASFSSCGLAGVKCPWEREGDPEGRKRPCNFHAISKMGGRSKVHAVEQIGRFGIGFVSVYQITDTPIIRSSRIQLLLNPLTGEALPQVIDASEGTEFELPWASSPSDIRNALNASPTPADVASKLVGEVENALRTSLLFLRHLKRVEVRQDGVLRLSIDIDQPDDIERPERKVKLSFGPDARPEQWLVLTRNATDLIEQSDLLARYETLTKLDRSRIVSVAVPLDTEDVGGLLYAYLPTKHGTNMPLHVNGDFFPHASRQDIVLSGEGHERYWNETLLATAAAIIGENFGLLRDELSHKRLWELGGAAFKLKDSGAFSGFWIAFSTAARTTPSVWTTGNQWHMPGEVHMAPEQLTDPEQSAVSSIGIELLHPALRPHWVELSLTGVTELRLATIVGSLEARGEEGIAADNPNLRFLWATIATMIDHSRKRTGFEAVIERLKTATFLIDLDGQPICPSQVWRMPESVPAARVRRYIPHCPIVHNDVMRHSQLAEMIDEYGLDEFANDLSEDIKDSAAAEARIGTAPDDVRGLYILLTCFPSNEATSNAGSILTDTPILWASSGFVSPSRGQLPGGFRDPIGHFELVDDLLFTPAMDYFARHILWVRVLSFHEYIDDHLEDILSGDLTREQYRALLAEIVAHKNELDDEGTLDLLASKSFVRTRSESFVRPDECYYWSAELETLIGDDSRRWVDESWMPTPIGARLRDLLEGRLGMPTTVSARHIVDRIGEIADHGTPDDVADAVTPIVRHVIERWAYFSDDNRETLTELRNIEFLPALVDGERDDENLYLPNKVYRAGRAAGFSSQVPVVDLTPLRQTGMAVNEFLDLIEMPSEPPTGDVVAHLQHCMANSVGVSDVTYAILNERVERQEELAAVDQLAGSACIFHGDLSCYIPADRVFWFTPPFGSYWHTANSRMRQREQLYRRLGVEDQPGPANYAALMTVISRKPDRTNEDLAIHAQCLGHLAEALEQDDDGVEKAIEDLRNDETLISIEGEPVWPEEAIWLDSEQLAASLGAVLNERLVRQPNVHRTAAARLFRRLGLVPLSNVAHLRLATQPDDRAAPEATEQLRERGDLLLWLAPNPGYQAELKRILSKVEIHLTEKLSIQAEISESDPLVRSPAQPAAAFYDQHDKVLHVRGTTVSSNEWAAAFRVLFSEIEGYSPSSDVKPLVTTASLVMLLQSREEAEQTLRQSDFRPPDASIDDIPVGRELGEAPEDDASEMTHEKIGHLGRPGEAAEDTDNADTVEVNADGGVLDEDEESAAPDVLGDIESGDFARSRRSAFGGPAQGEGGSHSAAEYNSKSGGSAFGAEPENISNRGPSEKGQSERGTSGASLGGKKGTARRGETRSERHVRRSRMLAYVAKTGSRGADDSEYGRSSDDVSDLIDVAAIGAALKYEGKRGWTPEEQPHGNPGYDIISMSPEGARRLIEVKGLEGDWTERGVKLSHVQYKMAEDYPDEFWIYVVENARNLEQQRVSAIGNPFMKVEEYWFDHNWRDLSEEMAGARELNVRVGATVRHKLWGVGTITEVVPKGLLLSVKIDFGFEGMKFVPYNSSLQIID